jgi:hypothetical protein
MKARRYLSIRTVTTHPAIVAASLAAPLAAAAVVGWTREPAHPRPTIRIVDVRPLSTTDPDLRDLLGHHLSVRVATRDWDLEPVRGDLSGLDPRPRLRHWRLYVDGHPLSDSFVDVAFTSYLPPGDHWLIAELRRPDHTSLQPPVWSEPVLLHIPRVFGQRRTDEGSIASKPAAPGT